MMDRRRNVDLSDQVEQALVAYWIHGKPSDNPAAEKRPQADLNRFI
jgi:hypothetical protein